MSVTISQKMAQSRRHGEALVGQVIPNKAPTPKLKNETLESSGVYVNF